MQWKIYKGAAIMVGWVGQVWTAATLNSSKALQKFRVAGLAELGLPCVYISDGEIVKLYGYDSNPPHHKGTKETALIFTRPLFDAALSSRVLDIETV